MARRAPPRPAGRALGAKGGPVRVPGGRAGNEGAPGSPKKPLAEDEGNLVLLGEFGRPHGLRGEVRLKSFTADPSAIASYGPLVTSQGRVVRLETLRAAGSAPDLLIARVAEIATREDAEALTGVGLFASRDQLGLVMDEDEFLAADLIGLAAEDLAGRRIGRIVSVPNYGGGDLLEIAPEDGGASILIAFTKAFVPQVDLGGRRVVLDPPAESPDVEGDVGGDAL